MRDALCREHWVLALARPKGVGGRRCSARSTAPAPERSTFAALSARAGVVWAGPAFVEVWLLCRER
jgi:hypothetical protein